MKKRDDNRSAFPFLLEEDEIGKESIVTSMIELNRVDPRITRFERLEHEFNGEDTFAEQEIVVRNGNEITGRAYRIVTQLSASNVCCT